MAERDQRRSDIAQMKGTITNTYMPAIMGYAKQKATQNLEIALAQNKIDYNQKLQLEKRRQDMRLENQKLLIQTRMSERQDLAETQRETQRKNFKDGVGEAVRNELGLDYTPGSQQEVVTSRNLWKIRQTKQQMKKEEKARKFEKKQLKKLSTQLQDDAKKVRQDGNEKAANDLMRLSTIVKGSQSVESAQEAIKETYERIENRRQESSRRLDEKTERVKNRITLRSKLTSQYQSDWTRYETQGRGIPERYINENGTEPTFGEYVRMRAREDGAIHLWQPVGQNSQPAKTGTPAQTGGSGGSGSTGGGQTGGQTSGQAQPTPSPQSSGGGGQPAQRTPGQKFGGDTYMQGTGKWTGKEYATNVRGIPTPATEGEVWTAAAYNTASELGYKNPVDIINRGTDAELASFKSRVQMNAELLVEENPNVDVTLTHNIQDDYEDIFGQGGVAFTDARQGYGGYVEKQYEEAVPISLEEHPPSDDEIDAATSRVRERGEKPTKVSVRQEILANRKEQWNE